MGLRITALGDDHLRERPEAELHVHVEGTSRSYNPTSRGELGAVLTGVHRRWWREAKPFRVTC